MAKKRKTLPKDFNELLEEGDIEKLKDIFNKCELNAYGGYNKQTALAFDLCPDELTYWLIEQGADIHAHDGWKRTPLHSRARSWRSNIKILLDLGADINNNDPSHGTPLHFAIDSHNPGNVEILLEHNADVNALNKEGFTPLEFGLYRCRNIDIIDMVRISKLMLEAGAMETPRIKDFVAEIGKTFEFHRSNFNPEEIDKYDSALKELYKIFKVEPISQRKMHDGKSKITIKEQTWQKQHQELWDYLVPSQGAAKTIQGEVIRISGRIANELEGNGGINWDIQYKKMADAFLDFIKYGNSFSEDVLNEMKQLIDDIKHKKGDSSRLAEIAVQWVLKNLDPIKLPEISYKR